MVVNQLTGAPVYYRTYNGNVTDVSTVKHMLQEKARIKLDENAVFVADKGYSSISNIHRFFQSKCSFLLNVKTGFTFCKDAIKLSKPALQDPMNFYLEINNSIVSQEFDWSYPVNFSTNCKHRRPHLKEKIFVHMYYDSDIYDSCLKSLKHNIAQVARLIKSGQTVPPELKYFEDKFITKKLRLRA